VRKASFSYCDGELRVVAPLATYRLRWLPEAKAEELLVAPDRWKACWPDFRLLKPAADSDDEDSDSGDNASRAAAFSAFRAEILPAVVSAVERFSSHQWPMLEMLAKQPLSIDLATSNPALAFALANNNAFRRTRIDAAGFQAAAYSLRKQRWILEWLGFPGTAAMVKLFKRIPPQAVSPSLLRRLRNAVEASPGIIDMLAHIRPLNEAVLGLAVNMQLRDLISPELLLEVAQTDYDEGEMTPGDIVLSGMATLNEIQSLRRLTSPFTSLAQVHRFQQKVDAEYQQYLVAQEAARQAAQEALERQQEQQRVRRASARKARAQAVARSFPPPPIPGTVTIIPLASRGELQEEGWQQSNCVATYATRVLSGDCYIYRVTAPERATLSIVYRADGCWRRSELKGHRNRAVRAETIRVVDAWLRKYRVSV